MARAVISACIWSSSLRDEVNLAVKIGQKSPELELASCSLSIGTVDILNQLSFRIAQPGIYCLIGPNGAGKTSTFNAITGAVKIQAGSINLDDESISGFLSHDVAMRGIGRKFQVPSILPNLTISENLRTALWGGRCSLMDLFNYTPLNWTNTINTDLKERFPFLIEENKPAKELSHGEKQVLELSMSLR